MNQKIYEIYISDIDIEYDLINWFASHYGDIHHISTIFRIYAKYKYNLTHDSEYIKTFDIFKYKKDTMMIIKNYASGTMIRGYPSNLLDFFKKN